MDTARFLTARLGPDFGSEGKIMSLRAILIFLIAPTIVASVHAQSIATLKGHKHTITALAWSPDGKTLASGAKDETVILWNVADKTPRATLGGHKDMVITVRFSPDSRTLASV